MHTAPSDCGGGDSIAPPTGGMQPPLVPPVLAPPIVAGGTAQAADSIRSVVSLDPAGHLAEDIACRQCGYNLRGLGLAQSCPECSLGVQRSVRLDLIQFANPNWVKRLVRGLRFTLIGVLAAIVVQIIGGFAIAISFGMAAGGGMAPANPFNSSGFTLIVGLTSLTATACTAFTVFGAWLFTSPDPGKPDRGGMTARTLARWCPMANLVAAPAGMLSQSAGMGAPGIGSIFHAIMWISVLLSIVATIGQVALLVHLRRIMIRVPRARLVKQIRIVTWGYGVAMGLAMIAAIVNVALLPQVNAAAGMGGGPGGGPTGVVLMYLSIMAIGGCGGGLGALVFGIWGIVLLFCTYFALKATHAEAARNWAGGAVVAST